MQVQWRRGSISVQENSNKRHTETSQQFRHFASNNCGLQWNSTVWKRHFRPRELRRYFLMTSSTQIRLGTGRDHLHRTGLPIPIHVESMKSSSFLTVIILSTEAETFHQCQSETSRINRFSRMYPCPCPPPRPAPPASARAPEPLPAAPECAPPRGAPRAPAKPRARRRPTRPAAFRHFPPPPR